jgi:hypothetical protein
MTEDKLALLRESPVVYQAGKPTSVIVDIELFQYLLNRLEDCEDYDLFNDPKVIAGLQAGQADLQAGRVTSMADLVKELGLEDELRR